MGFKDLANFNDARGDYYTKKTHYSIESLKRGSFPIVPSQKPLAQTLAPMRGEAS